MSNFDQPTGEIRLTFEGHMPIHSPVDRGIEIRTMMMFHATYDVSTHEIAVVRTPEIGELENPFIFRDPEEMQSTFIERYELVDVDVLIEQLEDFGSANFSA